MQCVSATPLFEGMSFLEIIWNVFFKLNTIFIAAEYILRSFQCCSANA